MWSLSQEEQFYLVWPLLLLLALRKRVDPTRIAVALVAVAIGLVIYRTFVALSHASPGYLLYSPELRSVGLVLGCLAGVLFSYDLVRRVPLWFAAAMLVPGALSVTLLDLESRWDDVTLVPLFCFAAAVVLLACVLHPTWWFARLIDRAWLRGFGKISYGLYLWHWPLYYALGWKLGLPLAILVAAASYRYVEQPFLRRRYPSKDQTATAPRRKSTISPVVAPGPKTAATPIRLELVGVVRRDRSAHDHEHVVGAVRAEAVDDPGHQRHVRAGEDRHADGVRVLLDRGLDDLLRGLVEARVDDLHACVSQGSRDDLRAAVMPVEAGLRDDHSYRARHIGRIPRCA